MAIYTKKFTHPQVALERPRQYPQAFADPHRGLQPGSAHAQSDGRRYSEGPPGPGQGLAASTARPPITFAALGHLFNILSASPAQSPYLDLSDPHSRRLFRLCALKGSSSTGC